MNTNNILRRLYDIILKPKDTYVNIRNKPTRISLILIGTILFYSLIFYFLLLNPNLWKNLFFIQFSGLGILELMGIFFVLVVIFTLLSIGFIILINYLRQLITKKGKKKKIVILNHYFYSLSPFLFFLTQIPFLLILTPFYLLLDVSQRPS